MRRGFAKEALNAVIRYCFEDLESKRLYACINVANINSINSQDLLFYRLLFDRDAAWVPFEIGRRRLSAAAI